MPKVKYIASPTDMPADQRYVLVKYGEEYRQTRQPLGFAITVARQQSNSISELSFLTAVHTAKGIAKKEGDFRGFCLQIARRLGPPEEIAGNIAKLPD
jgi:hypothetical protein